MNQLINKRNLYNLFVSNYFWLFSFAVLNLLVAFFYIKAPVIDYPDSNTYLSAMRFLQNGVQDSFFIASRVLTAPLMLYFSMFVGWFFGNLSAGMVAVNTLFYFLSAVVFYRLTMLIYNNGRVALFAAIFFLANYCILNSGLARLVDMGGWFFFILSSYWALNYYLKKGKKFYWLAILASAVGFLFKEYALLGMVTLSFLILFSDYSKKTKFKEIIQAGAVFLAIVGSYHLWYYCQYHYSYLDWYIFNFNRYAAPAAAERTYNPVILIKVVGWLFSVGWFVWLFGCRQEWKSNNKARRRILLAMMPASISFLFWPGFAQRVAFILVPWLALTAGFGLSKLKSQYLAAILLIIYILANYNIDWLMKTINLPF
jgi:4-amino-4-deoxy-L-arabinose transferase-like glycosyltransferase